MVDNGGVADSVEAQMASRRKPLKRATVNELVESAVDEEAFNAVIANAVTKAVVHTIEYEVSRSQPLKALIRGAMVKFVNGKEFEAVLMESIKKSVASLD